MSDTSELLPCSCGWSQPTQMMAREICRDMNSPLWHKPQTRVWCIGCGKTVIKASADEAIECWNRRPSPGIGESKPVKDWRCFHCDEVFTDEAAAREHFGTGLDQEPLCQVTAERYREVERQLDMYRTESDAMATTFYRLGSEHYVKERDAEQKGYDRGLADAKAYPEDIGLRHGGESEPVSEEAVEAAISAYIGSTSSFLADQFRAALTAARPYLSSRPIAATALVEAATVEIERLRDLHCTRREAFEIIGDDDKAKLLSDFVGQLAGLRDTISALIETPALCVCEAGGATAWQPMETAPKDIAVVMEVTGSIVLRHSYPIWARIEGGEAREVSWCQKGAIPRVGYWWDWDAEDVVDPDEWLPHPCALIAASTKP